MSQSQNSSRPSSSLDELPEQSTMLFPSLTIFDTNMPDLPPDTSDNDMSFAEPTSSQEVILSSDASDDAATLVLSESLVKAEINSLKIESVRDTVRNNPDIAKSLLESLKAQNKGFCRVVDMKPSKENGYVQLSYSGANKFATLQEVILWAGGGHKDAGDDCSHLCHNPLCKVITHIVNESKEYNNNRKGCLVAIKCHHCDGFILLCPHWPLCIKYIDGYATWEDYTSRAKFCRIVHPEIQSKFSNNNMNSNE